MTAHGCLLMERLAADDKPLMAIAASGGALRGEPRPGSLRIAGQPTIDNEYKT